MNDSFVGERVGLHFTFVEKILKKSKQEVFLNLLYEHYSLGNPNKNKGYNSF